MNGTGTKTKASYIKTATKTRAAKAARSGSTPRGFFEDFDSDAFGKDEMNLVEHPFALLTRPGGNRNNQQCTIELEWTRQHPITHKMIQSSWRVQGDTKLGLPGPAEERLLLILLELTRAANWSQTVHFSRYELVKRMGLTNTHKNYRTVQDSLTRLGARIVTKNSFWDARAKDYYTSVEFNILDEVRISNEPAGRRAGGSQAELPLSSFKWSDCIYQSFLAGNIRTLNIEFALSLDLPLAVRLYRFLDKHRYGKNGKTRATFSIGLSKLCEIHLGMTPTPYPSKLKERLRAAHEELMEKDFLSAVQYAPMKTRDGEKVTYLFSVQTQKASRESGTAPDGAASDNTSRRVPPSRSTPMPPREEIAASFGLVDDDLRDDICDRIYEQLPQTERDRIRSKAHSDLPQFLQMEAQKNTPGAKRQLQRNIRAMILAEHSEAVRSQVNQELLSGLEDDVNPVP